MHQASRDCHSRENSHYPNSIISSIGTSNPPELSCLTGISVLSFLLHIPSQAEGQDLLRSPAPKQLQWHLASRACRCLILECFMAGEMNAQPQSCMSEETTERRTPDEQFSRYRRMVSLPERGAIQQCLPQQVPGPENLSKKRKKQAKLWKLPSPQLLCLLARAQLVIDSFGWITGLETSENVGTCKYVQKDAEAKKPPLVLH